MDMYYLTGILKNTQYWVRSLHHKQGPVGSGMRTQEYGANLLEEMGLDLSLHYDAHKWVLHDLEKERSSVGPENPKPIKK